jgi:hypothetical protein
MESSPKGVQRTICCSLGSGGGDSLKSPARVKKIQLLQQQMLSKAPTDSLVGAFVLSVRSCAKTQVQNLDGLRHYTSGKPFLSSAFSSASDPKPYQADPIRRPFRPD